MIELRSCPLLASARAHPEVVCDVHLGLVVGLLEHAGAGPEQVRAELDPWGLADGCRLSLTWVGEGGATPA